jgi:hypothetical protein
LTLASPGERRPGRRVPLTPVVGVTVHDVYFVLLTIAVFVLLGLIAKGAEKL